MPQSHTNDDIIPLNIIIGSGSNVHDFKNSRKKTSKNIHKKIHHQRQQCLHISWTTLTL
jgi:hypothetical protein